jgi:hypothetical protein
VDDAQPPQALGDSEGREHQDSGRQDAALADPRASDNDREPRKWRVIAQVAFGACIIGLNIHGNRAGVSVAAGAPQSPLYRIRKVEK